MNFHFGSIKMCFVLVVVVVVVVLQSKSNIRATFSMTKFCCIESLDSTPIKKPSDVVYRKRQACLYWPTWPLDYFVYSIHHFPSLCPQCNQTKSEMFVPIFPFSLISRCFSRFQLVKGTNFSRRMWYAHACVYVCHCLFLFVSFFGFV